MRCSIPHEELTSNDSPASQSLLQCRDVQCFCWRILHSLFIATMLAPAYQVFATSLAIPIRFSPFLAILSMYFMLKTAIIRRAHGQTVSTAASGTE